MNVSGSKKGGKCLEGFPLKPAFICLKLSLVTSGYRAWVGCSLHSGSAPWVALSASSIPTGATLRPWKKTGECVDNDGKWGLVKYACSSIYWKKWQGFFFSEFHSSWKSENASAENDSRIVVLREIRLGILDPFHPPVSSCSTLVVGSLATTGASLLPSTLLVLWQISSCNLSDAPNWRFFSLGKYQGKRPFSDHLPLPFLQV